MTDLAKGSASTTPPKTVPPKPSFRRKAFLFIFSTIYFIYWSYAFALGATLGIVAAFVPLVIELFGGVYHAGEIPAPGEHWARWLLLAGYWLLLLAFALRHMKEAKQQQRERYALAFRLGRLYELEEVFRSKGNPAGVENTLRHIHAMFEPLQIAHVALHRKQNGLISIDKNEVFPLPHDPDYLIAFEEGKGVAGRVFRDSVIRYVPRIYLPSKRRWTRSIFLPHALTLKFEVPEGVLDKEPAISDVDMELYALEQPEGGRFLFNSFLSLPVRSPSTGECVAVLSLDFEGCNSMKKGDIALAQQVAYAVGKVIFGIPPAVQRPEKSAPQVPGTASN